MKWIIYGSMLLVSGLLGFIFGRLWHRGDRKKSKDDDWEPEEQRG